MFKEQSVFIFFLLYLQISWTANAKNKDLRHKLLCMNSNFLINGKTFQENIQPPQ